MAFNPASLSGSGAIVLPADSLSSILREAPNFSEDGPFTRQLGLDKELQSRMFNTAMEGGALIKQEKIRRDGLIEAAKIQSGKGGGLGSRLAAVAGLLGSMDGGTRKAGQAMIDPLAQQERDLRQMEMATRQAQLLDWWGQRSTIAGVAGLTGSQG